MLFQTRGVVLVPSDLSLKDWPQRAKAAGLNAISLHGSPSQLAQFVRQDEGQRFLEMCADLELMVEYECHALRGLLPRDRFEKDPTMFRMNEEGERTPDWNLCVHSEAALATVCENVARYAGELRPTPHRHYYWTDDAQPMCRCPKCRGYSDSDQALMLENRMLHAIRASDPQASLAHLAYLRTLPPPTQVQPESGVFLEYAPIMRRHDLPLSQRAARLDRPDVPDHGEHLDALDGNLEVFGADGAQVLEYWLDVSRFAGWKRENIVPIPWDRQAFADDLRTYAARGIQHVKSFAVWLDTAYMKRFGEPPLDEYGAELASHLCSRYTLSE